MEESSANVFNLDQDPKILSTTHQYRWKPNLRYLVLFSTACSILDNILKVRKHITLLLKVVDNHRGCTNDSTDNI